MAYKSFQDTKDRYINTDTGVKIYWRCEDRKLKHFLFFLYKSVFDQISTKFRRNSTNFRSFVVVDQTSFRRNGFQTNVMDHLITSRQVEFLSPAYPVQLASHKPAKLYLHCFQKRVYPGSAGQIKIIPYNMQIMYKSY